jgi:TetR/AcrR family transcriptional regulator
MMTRPKTRTTDTRERILAAAGDEFGAHGFAATTVDRIAARARVNKAMIYYHFRNKRELYTCIIRDVFAPISNRVRAAIAEDAPPDRKLATVIDTLVRSVDESTYFLPVFLREIADGGAHLGPEELALIAGMFATVSGIIVDGGEKGDFQRVHPALAHFTLIGPLVMFRATAPVRARIRSVHHLEIPDADSDTMVRHLQMVANRMLAVSDIPKLEGQRAEDRGKRAEGGGQREEGRGQSGGRGQR